jgi:hypothetical protein
LLQNAAGALVTSGTTNLYLYEVQSDGTLKSYDWNDNTFKTTSLTTETQALTHRTGNNSTTNTGIWTYALSTLTGFTVGAVYLARVNNTSASPTDQYREFQYGSAEGDLKTTANGTGVAELNADVIFVSGSSTAGTNLSNAYAAFETGTAQAGGAASITLRSGAVATDSYYNNQAVFIMSGTGAGQTNKITAYVGSTKVATVSTAWVTQPDNTSVYIVLGRIG